MQEYRCDETPPLVGFRAFEFTSVSPGQVGILLGNAAHAAMFGKGTLVNICCGVGALPSANTTFDDDLEVVHAWLVTGTHGDEGTIRRADQEVEAGLYLYGRACQCGCYLSAYLFRSSDSGISIDTHHS